MWRLGRKMDVKEISRGTGLTEMETRNALLSLYRRRLILKEREIGPAGYKSPPKGKIKVKLNEKVIKRIKKIVKNDR